MRTLFDSANTWPESLNLFLSCVHVLQRTWPAKRQTHFQSSLLSLREATTGNTSGASQASHSRALTTKKCTKCVIHVQSCCFAYLNLLLCCCARCCRRRRRLSSLMTGSEGNRCQCSSMFLKAQLRKTLTFDGNKIHCFPRDQPYIGYIGMCRCEGYGFRAVYSRIGYINQSVWVKNRISFFRKLISWLKILSGQGKQLL